MHIYFPILCMRFLYRFQQGAPSQCPDQQPAALCPATWTPSFPNDGSHMFPFCGPLPESLLPFVPLQTMFH